MIHLYSEQSAMQELRRFDGEIGRICRECGLPPAYLKAVLILHAL